MMGNYRLLDSVRSAPWCTIVVPHCPRRNWAGRGCSAPWRRKAPSSSEHKSIGGELPPVGELHFRNQGAFGLFLEESRTHFDKVIYKTNSTTPALGILKNLMRHLTAWLEDYCSITVANHQLITIIRFAAKNYIIPEEILKIDFV